MRVERWNEFEAALERLAFKDSVENAILRAAQDAVEVVDYLCAECGSTDHNTIVHSA